MAEALTSQALEGIPHGFSTRNGLKASDILPGAPQVLLRQVHSARVVTIHAPFEAEPPEADALATATPGLVLGIVTADCAPVLLADREAAVIAGAHAGWRGAVGGILENTVAAMVDLGAKPARIVAAIGPTIAQASYEVDAAFRDHFDEADARFFAPGREGHWQFDLPAYVAHRLHEAGVETVDNLGRDTYGEPEAFFSYRRATHRGEETGGRQISLIGLH